MRDWKRWTAVLLAGSLAFTAADDMKKAVKKAGTQACLLYTSPSPRD